jgi:hypothetical protein
MYVGSFKYRYIITLMMGTEIAPEMENFDHLTMADGLRIMY